jgi:hypothetical protein
MAKKTNDVKKVIERYYAPVEDPEAWYGEWIDDSAKRLQKEAQHEKAGTRPRTTDSPDAGPAGEGA